MEGTKSGLEWGFVHTRRIDRIRFGDCCHVLVASKFVADRIGLSIKDVDSSTHALVQPHSGTTISSLKYRSLSDCHSTILKGDCWLDHLTDVTFWHLIVYADIPTIWIQEIRHRSIHDESHCFLSTTAIVEDGFPIESSIGMVLALVGEWLTLDRWYGIIVMSLSNRSTDFLTWHY